MSFKIGMWLAKVTHLDIEIHLAITPRGDKLGHINHDREMEKGFLHPRGAELTSDHREDAEV